MFGGADFGAGFWSLFAGRGDRGARARELIDWAIGPVWEANHVWLIFVLVVLWTGFSAAFAAIFSTLFIPLSLAALGIVLRGSGFAFHKTARRTSGRQAAERLFGLSSLLTPFFMGTVVGAVAAGRVPVGNAAGDPVTSWLNPLSVLIGALFVATSAYLAAVFLISDARRAGAADLERYFTARALVGRRGGGSAGRRGHPRAALGGAVRLRRPHRRRAAARRRVAAVRRRRARARRAAARAGAPACSPSAPSWPSSGAGGSPSTRTCCPGAHDRRRGGAQRHPDDRADRVRRRRPARGAVDGPPLHARSAEHDRGGRRAGGGSSHPISVRRARVRTSRIRSMPAQHHPTEEDSDVVQRVGLLVLGMLLFWPRFVLFGFAIVDSGLIRGAFDGWVAAVAGFVVLPWTTLAYASMWSISSNVVSGWEWAAVGVAFLLDVWTWSAFRPR